LDLLWEGRRRSDRNERFLLYRRAGEAPAGADRLRQPGR
jgi:hypothetical protein